MKFYNILKMIYADYETEYYLKKAKKANRGGMKYELPKLQRTKLIQKKVKGIK